MKWLLYILGGLIAPATLFATMDIVPLSQRSVFEIPNQTEFNNFGELRNKRRLGMGTGYQGIANDFSFLTEVHLFESQSVRININPSLDNLFLSAGLKSWINDEIFSPYWVFEAWNLSEKRNSDSNGISGSLGLQFNKINDSTAGTSIFLELTALSDFKRFGVKTTASGGIIYNF